MTAPLLSRLPLDARRARGRVERRTDMQPFIRSQAFDWPGMLLEAGRNDVTSVEGLTLAHHYIALNVDHRPVVLRDVKEANGRRDVTLPPGTAWVVPAGDPVSLRVDVPSAYVRLTVEPRHVEALLRRAPDESAGLELRRAYAIRSTQLTYLMMALVAEAEARNPGGLAFVEMLTAAVGHQLAQHAGVREAPAPPARGGLAPGVRRRVMELIDAKLDARLSVDTLAREAGLSVAHFARAFKQTVGRPPHRYLLSQRLERARRMLENPCAQLSDVALSWGFADQAHFTRHFKREFGVTPGALVRGRCR